MRDEILSVFVEENCPLGGCDGNCPIGPGVQLADGNAPDRADRNRAAASREMTESGCRGGCGGGCGRPGRDRDCAGPHGGDRVVLVEKHDAAAMAVTASLNLEIPTLRYGRISGSAAKTERVDDDIAIADDRERCYVTFCDHLDLGIFDWHITGRVDRFGCQIGQGDQGRWDVHIDGVSRHFRRPVDDHQIRILQIRWPSGDGGVCVSIDGKCSGVDVISRRTQDDRRCRGEPRARVVHSDGGDSAIRIQVGSGGGSRPSTARKRHHGGAEIASSLIRHGDARQLTVNGNRRRAHRGRGRAGDVLVVAATDRLTIPAESPTRDEG